MLFLSAGTFDYWQAWVLIALFTLPTWVLSIYMLRNNPAALERRLRAEAVGETRMFQKVIASLALLLVMASIVFSALDHRFGWSPVQTTLCLVGDVVVAIGLGFAILVMTQNAYAGTTVLVEAEQRLVSTGLYGLVRHPMYTGNVIMMMGIPLALGSYWELTFVIPGVVVFGLRIRDEEALLMQELSGYHEYAQQVQYRLVPYVW
ncbi:MAG: isoprenylcysteine carboxylmethyltransferase family protein [Mycobacterium sp.]|nr:isoprenylcysteine carboxylmethyltransferase family protein [Mycobacterium sp.]